MATVLGALDESAVQELRAGLRGRLLQPTDAEYDGARMVWNAMIDRRPALIVRCAGVADVIQAVNFARTHDLLLSVRGGGHNVSGNAVAEGGLMIDLSGMKGIRVDPERSTARAEPGATWADLDHETQAFGLATVGGFVPSTGIAGLTLGGGLGYLMRRFGLACDTLMSADVVTADGRLLTASATQNEDLFWAIRGGGGNFGIVTSFEYQVYPVGPMVLGGLILHPFPAAKAAAEFYREFTSTAPDELTVHLGLVTGPDGNKAAAFIVCYSGALEQGEELIRPLREFGPPVADMVGPLPYTALQGMGENFYPHGRRGYWKSSFVKELSDAAIDTLLAQFAMVPSPFGAVALEHMGGAVSRVADDATAFGKRDALYSLIITGEWLEASDDEANIRWTRNLWEAMRPYETEAAYVNYLGTDDADRVVASYGAEKYARLAAIKRRYDPTNLFRLNQNIAPGA